MSNVMDFFTAQQSPIEQEITTIISHRMENRIPRKFFYKVLNQLDITTYVIAGNARNLAVNIQLLKRRKSREWQK